MTKKNKMVRKDIFLSENDLFRVETEYHRLHQELLKLKRSGIIPKSRRIREVDVFRVAIKLGLDTMNNLTYEQFLHIKRQS